jgi:predicted transcriptional regulator
MDIEMKKRVQLAIEQSGKTQVQIADDVGVTQQTVHQWVAEFADKGTLPRHNKLDKFCASTGVAKTWLVSGIGEMKPDAAKLAICKAIEGKLHTAKMSDLVKIMAILE